MTTQQHVHLTAISSNVKTGKIPVTTSCRTTCPDTCPLKRDKSGNGCYADGGPLAIHWSKVTAGDRGGNLDSLCELIKAFKPDQLWRHNQAGDLPGTGNRINGAQLKQITAANNGKRGFTYTHKPTTAANLRHIARANNSGFTINLSANNPQHADRLLKHGLPVVTIMSGDHDQKGGFTPAGNRIVTCPAAIDNTNTINCENCGLCQHQNRNYVIGFPVHGSSHKKAATACKL